MEFIQYGKSAPSRIENKLNNFKLEILEVFFSKFEMQFWNNFGI